MAADECETEDLIRRAGKGDEMAAEQLLAGHRNRLRHMVAVRMDPRLAARFDASDVVQETLVEASRRLPEYLQARPLPFYPWLRQIAWEQLLDLHRKHFRAQKRTLGRERCCYPLPDRSTTDLADRLLAGGTSPSRHCVRQELRTRMQAALAKLPERDREILVLRHLEQLSTHEIASVMGMTEGAVKTRHLRALQRLRGVLGDQLGEQEP